VQKTVAVVNVRLLVSLLAKQAAVLLIRSAKAKKASKISFKKRDRAVAFRQLFFIVKVNKYDTSI